VGTWFSNPAAGHGAAPLRSGVGKYLNLGKGARNGAAAGDNANGQAGPPTKKPKQAAYGNFDKW
jgi:hypothetical protein